MAGPRPTKVLSLRELQMAKRMLKSNKVPACQRELTALLNAMDRKDKGDGNVNIRILQTALEHCLHASVNVLNGIVGGWSWMGLDLGWDIVKACKLALDLGSCVPARLVPRSRIRGEKGGVRTISRFDRLSNFIICMARRGFMRRLKTPPILEDAAFFIQAYTYRLAALRMQKYEKNNPHTHYLNSNSSPFDSLKSKQDQAKKVAAPPVGLGVLARATKKK